MILPKNLLVGAALCWSAMAAGAIGTGAESHTVTPLSLTKSDKFSERVVCSIKAAIKYKIPVNAMLAVADTEGGVAGQWVRNTNGTFDVGAMQFNTRYLKELARYGITTADVAGHGCYPYDLAAWRIRNHIAFDVGDFWTRVANYHSRSPRYNAQYREKIMKLSISWTAWLRLHYDVYTATL